MVQLKTTIFIGCIRLWNWMTNSFDKTKSNLTSFYNHVSSYFRGDNNIWCIFSDHTLPLPLTMIHYPISINWKYDCLRNKLFNEGEGIAQSCKVSWLSSKLVVTGKTTQEYDLDPFFNDFCISSISNKVPTLSSLFLSWCIYMKHWFLSTDIIYFHIIDDMGEEHQLYLDKHNTCLHIHNQKLFFNSSSQKKLI
jgi:hypothetical protein